MRAASLFGLDGQRWEPDLTLQRYELLYEAGLAPEAARREIECQRVATDQAHLSKLPRDDGRVLVRYSGTESKARVMIEGTDENMIRAYAEEIVATMQKAIAP